MYVIGYLTKTSEVVVGEKCGQLCFLNNDIQRKSSKTCFFIRNKYGKVQRRYTGLLPNTGFLTLEGHRF
jgi:hypothetical protein